ncbi:MAG: ImcF-related family protein [Rhodopila sp.]
MASPLPDWTPASALGPAGGPLFVRRSGKPLTEGIPGFYTGTEERQMLAALPATARAVAAESWVLGDSADATAQARDPAALERAVIALYVADTEKHWDTLLDDLALARFGDRNATVQTLYVLASPQSPMRDLLTAIVQQLPPLLAKTDGKAADTPDSKRVAAALGAAQPGDATAMADAELVRHYAALRGFVGQGTSTPLTAVLGVVNALQAEIARSRPNTAGTPGVFQAEGDPVQLLRAEAQRQPAPVQRWLQQIAATGQTTLAANAQAAAESAYEGASGPDALCRAIVQGHYPFDPGSTVDAPIDGFARLFAPNGAFDSYFKTQLAPYTDTSRPDWRLAPLAGVAPPVDAGTIRIFQRAAAIRDTYFASGGATPEVRFSVAPGVGNKPDAWLMLGIIGIGGNDAGKAEGPKPVLWPGADGMQTISVMRDDRTLVRTQGPWALFRLLDSARGTGGTLTLDAAASGEAASFVISTDKTPNPLRPTLLQGFRCPAVH